MQFPTFLWISLSFFVLALSGQTPGPVELIQQSVELQRAGRIAEALALMRDLLARPGNSPMVTGLALNEMALALHTRNQYEEAEATYKRAIRTLEGVEDAPPVYLHRAHMNLASLYLEAGVPDKAERERSQVPAELLDTPADMSHAYSLGASIAVLAGDFDRAKVAYEENLAFLRRKGGPEDELQISTTLNNLGAIASRRQRWPEAEDYLLQALEAQNSISAASHPNLIKILVNLGYVQAKRRKYLLARQSFEEALTIAQISLTEFHPLKATILAEYAEVLSKGGFKREAKLVKREAASVRRQVPPSLPSGVTVDVAAFQRFTKSAAPDKTANAKMRK